MQIIMSCVFLNNINWMNDFYLYSLLPYVCINSKILFVVSYFYYNYLNKLN